MTETTNTEQTLTELAGVLYMKKAEDIRVLDLSSASSYLGHFVIASGLSSLHIRNLAGESEAFLKDKGYRLAYHGHNEPESGWLILDYGSFVVHLFTAEKRAFYKLDAYWSNARQVV